MHAVAIDLVKINALAEVKSRRARAAPRKSKDRNTRHEKHVMWNIPPHHQSSDLIWLHKASPGGPHVVSHGLGSQLRQLDRPGDTVHRHSLNDHNNNSNAELPFEYPSVPLLPF